MTPAPPEVTIFASPGEFRRWLEKNHATAAELWVGYYKKDSGKTSMTYQQAVEEALCFGWIDGVTRSFGDYYANRFTPRRQKSGWSRLNLERFARLESEGRMRPAGRSAYEARDREKDGLSLAAMPSQLLAATEERLRANAAAWAYWQAETPSYRRDAARWVLSAKREQTRERRLADLISDAAAGRRVRPFRYFEAG